MDLRNPDFGKDIITHEDIVVPKEDLPDYHRADSLKHAELSEKFEKIKITSINKKKEGVKPTMSIQNLFKPILYLLALIGAFVFAQVMPGSGVETQAITIVAAIATFVGVKDWRENFDSFKTFFKSKTLIGSALVLAPILVLTVVVGLLGFALPAWVMTVLTLAVSLGGGTALLGIFSAAKKEELK